MSFSKVQQMGEDIVKQDDTPRTVLATHITETGNLYIPFYLRCVTVELEERGDYIRIIVRPVDGVRRRYVYVNNKAILRKIQGDKSTKSLK